MANIEMETTQGPIKFADWLRGDAKRLWTIFFSHPVDFTSVSTTELGQCHDIVMAPNFAAMGAKLIVVSRDSVESHNAWAKNAVELATPDKAGDDLNFPIIGDADKSLVTQLGLLDPAEKDTDGGSMPARVLVILHGNIVKLTIRDPATMGRDFEEVKRVLTSLKLAVNSVS